MLLGCDYRLQIAGQHENSHPRTITCPLRLSTSKLVASACHKPLSELKLPPCITNNGEITPRWIKEVNQGQLGSMPVHPMDRDGLQWIDMDGVGCHWIMLDLEGGRLTQMAHHGITKLEIDFLWTAIDTDNSHQQPLPSIGISHTASLSMQHQRKSLAFYVMCI